MNENSTINTDMDNNGYSGFIDFSVYKNVIIRQKEYNILQSMSHPFF